MSKSCSFCGNDQTQVKKMIVGDEVAICNVCVGLCSDILDKEATPKCDVDQANIDPHKIKEYLDSYIVSQDSVKVTLSVAVVNHYKRLGNPNLGLEKSNVMLLGPTGSGKTMLARIISEYLEVPLVVTDATTMTEAGYVGDDVETVLAKLLQKADGDPELAQRGIVFLDEVDKIARKSGGGRGNHDVSGEGVQQALLKLVEGSVYKVPTPNNPDKTVDIDTNQILFMSAGAFEGMDKLKQRRTAHTQIGFTSSHDVSEIDANYHDLTEFGLIPEFVGRFPIVSELDALTEEDMLQILTGVKNNLIDQYTNLFELDEIDLSFDNEALLEIVQQAMKQKTGARGLRSILEKTLLDHMFNLHRYKEANRKTVEITKSSINTPTEVTKKIKDAKSHSSQR